MQWPTSSCHHVPLLAFHHLQVMLRHIHPEINPFMRWDPLDKIVPRIINIKCPRNVLHYVSLRPMMMTAKSQHPQRQSVWLRLQEPLLVFDGGCSWNTCEVRTPRSGYKAHSCITAVLSNPLIYFILSLIFQSESWT